MKLELYDAFECDHKTYGTWNCYGDNMVKLLN